MIPYDDFGGRGPLLHFSHPNGYTPACFRRFLAPFAEHYRVLAAHHRPLWYLTPGAPEAGRPEEVIHWDWDIFVDDLLRFLDEQGAGPVIGVGHSLGAVTTMLAARRRPERFRAIVLIDPVFLPPQLLELARANPELADTRPPVRVAMQRRHRWATRREAFDRFREKAVFARFSDEALWDYINEGLHDEGDEVVLSYPREWEARFYARPPTNVWDALPGLTVPTLAIRAAASDTLFEEPWRLWQSLQPGAMFVEIADVGHMLTMEQPETVAAAILGWLAAEA